MNIKFLNEKLIAYLVSSIIPLLSISIFLADFICTFSSILFIYFLIKNNPNIFYKNTSFFYY